MGSTDLFDLRTEILKWQKANLEDLGITDGDKTEITDHLMDTIDNLQKMRLSDEEVFVVAKMRLGNTDDWGQELKMESDDNFQVKKIINIFFGILIYFTFYFGIIASIYTLFIVLEKLEINAVSKNIDILNIIWKAVYIIIFLLILSCFINRNRLIPYLKRIKLSSIKLCITFVLFIAFLLGERFTRYYISDELLNHYENHRRLYFQVIHPQTRFEYFFPMLVCFSFLILFFLYRKKNYI